MYGRFGDSDGLHSRRHLVEARNREREQQQKKPCPTIVITLPVGACLVSAFRCLGRFFHAAWIDATRWLSIILHTLFMSCLVVFGFSEHWIRHGSMDQDALSHITNANLMRLMYRNILSDIMRIGIILSIIKTF